MIADAGSRMDALYAQFRGIRHGDFADHYQSASQMPFLEPGAVVYDIGAYRGVYSVLAAQKGHRVYAFEASPLNYPCLMQNCAGLNVTILPYGVHERTLHHSGPFNDCNAHESQCVDLFTLDTLMEVHRLPAPDLVKMDIEGMESVALKGASMMLAYRPILQISMHPGIQFAIPGCPGFVPVEEGGFDFSWFAQNGYEAFDLGANRMEDDWTQRWCEVLLYPKEQIV